MNVLVVGLGSIAGKHIQAIRELFPTAAIMALRSASNAETLEGIGNIFSLKELLRKPDFAIVSNPTASHYETIEELSELQIPLMIEKPAFHSLDGVPALVDKLKKKNIFTYVACNLRFHPVVAFLKSQLAGKRINEVSVYCGSFLPAWRPDRDFRTVYSANAKMGGGVHLDLIHELDYCYWLFGKPQNFTSVKTARSSLQIDAVDYAHYCLNYSNFTAAITLNYFRRDAKRQIEIVFDDTTWLADLLTSRITDEKNQVIFEQEFKITDSYKAQLRFFLDCLAEKATPMNSLEEACEVLDICLT
jgi:predicted dehydrogenase